MPNLPRVAVVAVDETDVVPYKGLKDAASRNSVQFNRRQRQTKKVLRQSTVTSSYKKGVGSKGLTFLATLKDKKKYADSIHLRETFDLTLALKGAAGQFTAYIACKMAQSRRLQKTAALI